MRKAIDETWLPCLNYRFAVGRDRHGRWVVCDAQGMVGGVFRDRASAVKFAVDESEGYPGQVFCVPDTQPLGINAIFGRRKRWSKFLRRAVHARTPGH